MMASALDMRRKAFEIHLTIFQKNGRIHSRTPGFYIEDNMALRTKSNRITGYEITDSFSRTSTSSDISESVKSGV